LIIGGICAGLLDDADSAGSCRVGMSITVGMLYQESTEQYCNAYLWDDQVMTGQVRAAAAIGTALIWTSRAVGPGA
jgi:hypothetical protein